MVGSDEAELLEIREAVKPSQPAAPTSDQTETLTLLRRHRMERPRTENPLPVPAWFCNRGFRHAGGSSSEEADNQCRLGLGCRGAFEKGERAEEKRSFRARARELQLAALKKHHENEISHHAKETECLKRETERHKRSIKKPDVVMTVVKCTQFSVEWLPIIAHFCVDYV
ncbi:hypothetical protein E5288_WYG008447 [Bos mutus]|uniref:ATPase inhibitor, mitochondrial n=1 Tax=Bos mutus TaxID=72004 RepID=A0A6B0S3S6_9CETA|nr:hypothetical protein [Bos mutus]